MAIIFSTLARARSAMTGSTSISTVPVRSEWSSASASVIFMYGQIASSSTGSPAGRRAELAQLVEHPRLGRDEHGPRPGRPPAMVVIPPVEVIRTRSEAI